MDKESIHRNELLASFKELESLKAEKDIHVASKQELLTTAELEPQRISRQTEAIEKAVESMDSELKALQRKVKNCDLDIEKQAKRKVEAEKLKKSLLEKLQQNRETIEVREQDVAVVKSNLELMKGRNHDLVTTKVNASVFCRTMI